MTNLIPDINLKTIINNYLSRDEEEDITKSDLESINGYIYSDISYTGKYICSMEGLQYAVNLTEFKLVESSKVPIFKVISPKDSSLSFVTSPFLLLKALILARSSSV